MAPPFLATPPLNETVSDIQAKELPVINTQASIIYSLQATFIAATNSSMSPRCDGFANSALKKRLNDTDLQQCHTIWRKHVR